MLNLLIHKGGILKKILIFLLALLMVFLTFKGALALPNLTVSMPADLDVFVGEDYFFNMTLSNIGDSSLINISFNQLRSTYFPNISGLGANSSSVYLVRVSPVEVFDESYILGFSYFYYVSEIPNPRLIDVTFDSTAFSISNISLFVGDSLRFVNDDSEAAVIKDYNDTFLLNIDSGGTGTNLFGSPGHYVVYHQLHGFVLNVYVEDASIGSLAHSNDLDVLVPVHIKSSYRNDELIVRAITDDMSGDFDKVQEGIVEVKNVGTRTVNNIYLSSDWIVFLENNFSLSAGNNKIFKFNLTPENITKTNQTNISYDLEILATSSNANSDSDGLKFFVNYHNFYEIAVGNYTINSVLLSAEESIALCSQNPTYPGCDKLIIEKPIEKITEKEATHEYTEAEIKEHKDAVANLDDVADRIGNKFNVVEEDVTALKNNMSGLTGLVARVADDLKKSNKSNLIRNIFFWTIFFVVIGGAMVFGYSKWHRYHKEKFENENEA